MSKKLSRRQVVAGGMVTLGALVLAKWRRAGSPMHIPWLETGDAWSFAAHRAFLPGQALAREFNRDQITPLPANGTTNPEDENYQRLLKGNFADWRLEVKGLVARPGLVSLADLKRLPSRTQVTQHNCEEGWSAVAEWTGVQLSRVLTSVGILGTARYVVFHCVDGWWDSIDMADALHPQTLLAYGMNGRELPVAHGAPIRLRVERQLGYKSLKFVTRVTVTDRLDNVEDGTGAAGVSVGYSWYSGI